MIFCKTPVRIAVFCLVLLACQLAAGDLEKWVPAGGAFYGKISWKVVRESSLFSRLLQTYPALRAQIDSSQELVGKDGNDLDTAVFTMLPGGKQGAVVLLEFRRPCDPAAITAGLKARGFAGKYRMFTVAGKTGFAMPQAKKEQPNCFVLLSDRVMFCGAKSTVEQVIQGPKISTELAQKLQNGMLPGVFLRAFSEPAGNPLLGGVQRFDAVGSITAESALNLNVQLFMADARSAKNAEMQLRQGMMLMLGMAFADDGELGLELMSRIKIKRGKNNDITVKAALPADLLERLVSYCSLQMEKRKQEEAERRARQKTVGGAPQGKPASR